MTAETRLDAAAAPEARSVLRGLVDSGCSRIVLDMAAVDFVDSTGLSVLVSCLKGARALGGDLHLAGVRPEVQALFELTRLDRVFRAFPDENTAVAAFSAT